MSGKPRDGMNQYPPLKANDLGTELVQIVIDWYRGHLNQFSSTEATNIGTEITNILNNTHKV